MPGHILSWLNALFVRVEPPAVQPVTSTDFRWPALPVDPVVLFLDFDGVMHRAENGSFERLPELVRLLEEFPALSVVFSTNWRLNSSPESLLRLFPQRIHSRFHGFTPDLADGQPHLRERECRAWARAYGVERFVALDDEASAFSPDCAFLVQTDRYCGLDEKALQRCRTAIAAQAPCTA